MSARVIQSIAVVFFVASALPTRATASPIFNFEQTVAGDEVVVNARFTLTLDDLRVLEARDDSGWHLGWFNRTLRGGSHDPVSNGLTTEGPLFDALLPDTLPISANTIGASLAGPAALLSQQAAGGSAGQSVDPVAMPEPASILMLASGLVVLARRIRQRRD